jgi:hypothetical protein
MRLAGPCGEDRFMEDNCRIVLRLEVLRSDQGPMSGLVVEPDGRSHDFSG